MALDSSALPRLGPSVLREDVLAILRRAILTGGFRPGERLVEVELAQRLGISRNPIREAFRDLEREGLVASLPHRGTFVATFTADDLRELYLLRANLEGLACRLAAERATPEDLRRLDELLARMGEAAGHGDVPVAIDLDFELHRSVVELSGARRLIQIWSSLASQIRLAMSLTDRSYYDLRYIVETHAPLLDAIRRKDSQAIDERMKYLCEVGEAIAQKLERSIK